MILRGTFTVDHHDEYGFTGLRMKNRPHFDPGTGLTIAHDLMEHFRDDDGTTEHELMALGAMLYVRDCGADMRASAFSSEPYEGIAADLIQQCFYMDAAKRTALENPGRTTRIDDEDVERQIQQVWPEAMRLMAHEFDNQNMYSWLDQKRLIGWLRRGYRRAARRYKDIPSWRTAETFRRLSEEADEAIKRYEDFLGTEITFRIDVFSNKVTWRAWFNGESME